MLVVIDLQMWSMQESINFRKILQDCTKLTASLWRHILRVCVFISPSPSIPLHSSGHNKHAEKWRLRMKGDDYPSTLTNEYKLSQLGLQRAFKNFFIFGDTTSITGVNNNRGLKSRAETQWACNIDVENNLQYLAEIVIYENLQAQYYDSRAASHYFNSASHCLSSSTLWQLSTSFLRTSKNCRSWWRVKTHCETGTYDFRGQWLRAIKRRNMRSNMRSLRSKRKVRAY